MEFGLPGSACWAPHPIHSWARARQVSCNQDKVELEYWAIDPDGTVHLGRRMQPGLHSVPYNRLLLEPDPNVDNDQQQQHLVDDLTQLQPLHDATILHTIRSRYAQDEIYVRFRLSFDINDPMLIEFGRQASAKYSFR
jgi:myosin heavy subunit